VKKFLNMYWTNAQQNFELIMLLANFLVLILIEARAIALEINTREFISVETQLRLENSM
jgi:hypothetical protein